MGERWRLLLLVAALGGVAACDKTSETDGGPTPGDATADAGAGGQDGGGGGSGGAPQTDTGPLADGAPVADAAPTPDGGPLPDGGPAPDAGPEDECPGPCQTGCTMGDPHFTTFDGVYYDFQATGEFVAVRGGDDDFEVQVRQEKSNLCAVAALNTAVAIRFGGEVVMVDNDAESYLTWNDQVFAMGEASVDLPGMSVREACSGLHIKTSRGDRVDIDFLGTTWFNVGVTLDPSRQGNVSGLFGDANGDPAGEPIASDGTAADPEFQSFYVDFGGGWQVTPETSLFTYAEGESTLTYAAGPPLGLMDPDQASAADRAAAEAACAEVADPTLHQSCLVDVLCVGGPDAAAGYADLEPRPVEFTVDPPAFADALLVEARDLFNSTEPVDGVYTHECPPMNGQPGRLWGTDIYTDDSYICEAAVHAGVIQLGVGGTVRFRELPGQAAYVGSVRNGMTSHDWDAWNRSFEFVRE